MKKSILIFGIIISLLFIFYYYDNKNNFLSEDKQNSNYSNEEFDVKVSNKGSKDLYRNVIISQKNNLYGKKINSKFSFIILLEQKDKIQFINPNNYDINYKIILDKDSKYEYEILSQYFKVTKDYANREFFNFYCTYTIKDLRNKNNESEIYHFNGEFEIKDIL